MRWREDPLREQWVGPGMGDLPSSDHGLGLGLIPNLEGHHYVAHLTDGCSPRWGLPVQGACDQGSSIWTTEVLS